MLYRLLAISLLFSSLVAVSAQAAFLTSKHKKDFSRLNFNWESQVEYDLSQKGNLVTIKFKRSHPVTKAQIEAQLKGDLVVLHSMTTNNKSLEITFELKKYGTALTLTKGGQVALDFVFDQPEEAEKPAEEAEKEKVKPEEKKEPEAKKEPEIKVPPKDKELSPEKKLLEKAAEDPKLASAEDSEKIAMNVSQEPVPPAPVSVHIEETVEGLKLIFDFSEARKAGAFMEGGDVWLFFDRPTQFSWDDSALKSSQLITDLVSYRSNNLSAIKVDFESEPAKASFYARGNQWVLETSDLQGILPIFLEPKRVESTIVIRDDTLGEPIFAQMPGTGCPRYFIPASPGASRVGRKFGYVDFALTPTILGVVIDPLSQGLHVEKKDQNIVVSQDGGLALSDAQDVLNNRLRYQPPSLMNFSEWKNDPAKTIRDFQEEIIATPKQARTHKRLEFARHYILNNRYFEARGLLAAARVYDPSLEKSPYFHSLVGLALFASRKYDEALQSFESPTLLGDPEMAVWAELSKCYDRPTEVRVDVLSAGAKYFANYPYLIKNMILLLAADVAVTQKQDNTVFLAMLNQDKLTPLQKDHLEYLKAYANAMAGKIPETITALEKYSKTLAPEFRLKSALLLTQLQSEAKSITPEEEIKILEKLRYSWTGDQNEYQLWNRLADRYLDTKDYERSLKFVRKAIRNYPKLASMDKLQQKGEKQFMDALEDKDGDLFKLIGIYQEYDIFIPLDERRFKIQDQLTDLLVKANLMDQAMDMLDRVLKDSSVDEEHKIRVRTRYGLLALLNDEPEKALDVLKYAAQETVPNDLAEQRKFLAAQAYLMLGKHDVTRELLNNDVGPAAFELVSQTFMDEKDWPNLVTYTEAYLQSQKAAGNPIEPEVVMRLVTALQLLNKPDELKKIREEHLALMATSPYKEVFELVTAEDPTDFSSKGLREELTKSQQLTKFLDGYREKVKNQGLSVL